MATPNDGSGRAPVAIVRPTTSVTSGVGVTQKLVTAAVAFGNLMQGTFGPQGLDKMLYKTNGETAVTNDGAKIIAELLVKHPAAQAFVQLAEAQEQSCGDGVTGCVVIAGELMREAGRLLERGLHPLVCVSGFQRALGVALEHGERVGLPLSDRHGLFDVARTSMAGTTADVMDDRLAELVVQAVNTVQHPDGTVHYEDVRMTKRTFGNLNDTVLINGMVLETPLVLDRLPRRLDGVKVVVLSCPLELESTSRDADIEVETTEQWTAFIEANERLLEAKVDAILASGARAVFCAGAIDPKVLHALADKGCFVLGALERPTVDDIAKATGAHVCDHLDDLEVADLGACESLWIETSEDLDGRRERIILDAGDRAGLATLDVGGGDGVAVEETIRGLHDALRSTALAASTKSVMVGGGAYHMGASLAVKEAAEQQPGRERLAMEAFARALEIVPATLAQNAGVDRLDTLLAHRAAHRTGSGDHGIARNGEITSMSGVLVPQETVLHGLELACETACGLLRVDQVISARGD